MSYLITYRVEGHKNTIKSIVPDVLLEHFLDNRERYAELTIEKHQRNIMQKPITIKWPEDLLEETKKIAKRRRLPYQTYIKMCVAEKNKEKKSNG